MIPVPSGVRVWLAVGRTDMRRGMNGLSLQVQETLGRDPFAGDLFVFRGRRGYREQDRSKKRSPRRSEMSDRFGADLHESEV